MTVNKKEHQKESVMITSKMYGKNFKYFNRQKYLRKLGFNNNLCHWPYNMTHIFSFNENTGAFFLLISRLIN